MVILLIFISGCNGGSVDVSGGIEKGIEWLSCSKYTNYKYIGGKCCIDVNQNGICEDDEPTPPKCKNECNFPNRQCHNGDVYSCEDTDQDGCTEFKLELNCADDESCMRGECIKNIECGDRVCDKEKENCDTCKQDCLGLNERCCDGESIAGECCYASDCGENQECQDYKCVDVEFCGNGICDPSTENCKICSQDCTINEGQNCCDEKIVDGNCCSDTDCKEGEICSKNICTTIEQPTNETETNTSQLNPTGNNS